MTSINTIAVASLTSFDWFLIALMLLSTFAAMVRGIIRVLFSLAGLIAGILLASWNYLALARWLHRWITNFSADQVIGFLFILLLVMTAFTIVGSVVRKTASAVGLGFFDRLLGAIFGLLRGILLGVAVMMVITAFIPASTWIKDSRLSPYFLAGAHAVSFVVPEHFQQQLRIGAIHLLQQSPELFRPHPLPRNAR